MGRNALSAYSEQGTLLGSEFVLIERFGYGRGIVEVVMGEESRGGRY